MAVGVVLVVVATLLAVGAVSPIGGRVAEAAPYRGDVCSGGTLSGYVEMGTWFGRSSGNVWVPAGSTMDVEGEVTLTGSLFGAVMPWALHPFAGATGTTSLGATTPASGSWTNTSGVDHLVTVSFSGDQALFATHYQWWFKITVENGDSCSPDADECLGTNIASPRVCDSHGEEGDPVDTATGNFNLSATDVTIAGRGAGLGLKRSYNSLDAAREGPFGFGWSWNYGMSLAVDGALATLVQESGSRVRFIETGSGWTSASWAVATLQENIDGTWTFIRGAREVFTFDPDGKLISIADLNGETTTLTYDGADRLATVTDPVGRELELTWTGDRITEVTDPTSRGVTFAYDASGDLMEVVDVAGGAWAYEYDLSHRLTSVRDPKQASEPTPATLSNVYDSNGRVTRQTDRTGQDTWFDYTAIPGATRITDPAGDVTVDYYTDGARTQTTVGYGTPAASTTKFEYDPISFGITAVTDPRGKVWRSTYDAAGNRTGTTDPLLRTTSATYSSMNLPLTVVDSDNVTTTYDYDSAGNLESISTPLVGSSPAVAATVSYIRSDTAHPGDVTSMVDARGKTWALDYDANGYRNEVIDPLGNTSTAEMNDLGWVQWSIAPRGNELGADPDDFKTSYTYNDYGDVLTIGGPENGSVTRTYDPNRNLVSSTDAENAVTTFGYDAEDRLIEVGRPDASVLHNEYYADGQLWKQLDAGGAATVFGYDQVGRLTSQSEPSGNTTQFGYDPSGNLTLRQDPGGDCTAIPKTGCVTSVYDDANQLVAVDYSDADTADLTAIAYDDAGRRTSVTDAAAMVTSWGWDSLGRLTSSSAAGRTTTYGYDLAGNLTSLAAPTGPAVTRTYDDAGHLTGVDDGASRSTSFTYDADSNWTSTTFPSSVNRDLFGYDNAGRMTSATFEQGLNTLASMTFDRDDLGLVTSEDLASLPGADSVYGYGALNQLTSWNAETFAYDDANNLTQFAAVEQGFNNDKQLCWTASTSGTDCATPPVGATTYEYDSQGNRTTRSPADGLGTSYGWDQNNRLTSVTSQEAGNYLALDPVRLLDTRGTSRTGLCPAATGQCTTFTSGSTREIQIAGQGGVPTTGVEAVVLSVATIGATSEGTLAVYPADSISGPSMVSTTEGAWSTDGANGQNLVFAKLSTDGRIKITSSVATDVVVDVQGWIAAAGPSRQGFTAMTPTVVADTSASSRQGLCPTAVGQCVTLNASNGRTRTVQVAGQGGVPANGVGSVVLAVTATASADGSLTVWPTGAAQPATGSLPYGNTNAGGPRSTLTIVTQVSADGRIDLHADTGSADVVVAVQGWYGLSGPGSVFNPSAPTRLLDTRSSSRTGLCPTTTSQCSTLGTTGGGVATRTVQVTGRAGVPATDVDAVILNVNVPTPIDLASLYAWETGTSRPTVAQLELDIEVLNTKTLIVPVSPTGQIDLAIEFPYSDPYIDVIADVVGWYGPGDDQTWTYAYDADGLRTTKTAPDGITVTTFDWDKSTVIPQLIAETTGVETTRYVYGPAGSPIEQVNPDGTVTYFHHDQLGSTRLLTTSAGAVSGSATYRPYGELEASTGTLSPLGYAGQYTDAETGLHYLRARYYEPETGQFLSRDPLSSLTGEPYGYAGGNPTNNTDPTGLSPADPWINGLRIVGQVAVVGAAILGGMACGASVVCGIAVGGAAAFGGYAAANAGSNRWSWYEATAWTALGGATGGVSAKLSGFSAAPRAAGVADEALQYATRAEKLDHIFVQRHNLGPLVRQFGSREAVVEQMLRGVSGRTPGSGVFEIPVSIGGQTVVVRGAVVNGVVKLGTAFTP